jgi:hypothetical protein
MGNLTIEDFHCGPWPEEIDFEDGQGKRPSETRRAYGRGNSTDLGSQDTDFRAALWNLLACNCNGTEATVKAASVHHARHNFLAAVTAFCHADGRVQAEFHRKVVSFHVDAKPGDSGLSPQPVERLIYPPAKPGPNKLRKEPILPAKIPAADAT